MLIHILPRASLLCAFLLSKELLLEVLTEDKLEQGAVIQYKKASHSTKIITSLSSFLSFFLKLKKEHLTCYGLSVSSQKMLKC